MLYCIIIDFILLQVILWLNLDFKNFLEKYILNLVLIINYIFGWLNMTIAIALKINDGIVLATDSASAIVGEENEDGSRSVYHTYFTADKLFNLKKGSRIGAMTWEMGA